MLMSLQGRCREAVSAGLGIRSSPPSPKSTRLPPTFLPPSVHLPPSFPLLQWPTFPQVYINGEFFGGADIVMASAQVGLMGGCVGRWCRCREGVQGGGADGMMGSADSLGVGGGRG